MTGLVLVLLLVADAGSPGAPDGGVRAPPSARSAEDEEVIRNLELLEHLTESQNLELLLELEAARAHPDSPAAPPP